MVGLFLPLFCVVDMKTINAIMLIRQLIMPGVEHAVQIIGVDLCLLVLRPRGSTVLQANHIMNAPGIL